MRPWYAYASSGGTNGNGDASGGGLTEKSIVHSSSNRSRNAASICSVYLVYAALSPLSERLGRIAVQCSTYRLRLCTSLGDCRGMFLSGLSSALLIWPRPSPTRPPKRDVIPPKAA
eukprot:1218074-Prymnesium_polylepis.2